MTILEQHIEVQQALQKIDSARFSSIEPEEIDWALNKAQERYVKNRVKPDPTNPGGYQVDIKSTQDLTSITNYASKPPTYINTTEQFSYINLAANCWFPIGVRSYVKKKCNGNTFNSTTTLTEQIYSIFLSDTTKTSSPYYEGANLFATNNLGFANFFAANSTGFNSKEEKFNFIPYAIGDKGSDNNVFRVYWERYENYYSQNNFLIVIPNNTTSNTITYSVDAFLDTVNFSTYQKSKYISNSIVSETKVPVRIVRQENIDELQQYPTYKTNEKSPLSILNESQIKVFFNDSFIVSSIGVDYIRKPLPVNITLGMNSEMPEHTHREICDLAVEIISLNLNKEDYQLRVQDRLMNK